MFTRGRLYHPYIPQPPGRIAIPGAMRTETVKGVTQTWVVSRPVTCFDPNNAPLYYQDNQPDCGDIMYRGGVMGLTPARPRLAMDPSNSDTWQRQYQF